MSKKHFVEAAKQVAEIRSNDPSIAPFVAEQFATLFQKFNPNFDRARFMAACGL